MNEGNVGIDDGTAPSRLSVTLDRDGPFDRAWMLLASVRSSFGADEWHEVNRRTYALDNVLRMTAIRRLSDAVSGHPQSRALYALCTAAREAVEEAGSTTIVNGQVRGVRRKPALSRTAQDAAGRALGDAVMSIALAPRLEPVDVALLASPVLDAMRTASDVTSS